MVEGAGGDHRGDHPGRRPAVGEPDRRAFLSVFFQLENITDKIFITSLKNIVYGLSAEEIKEKMQSLNIPTENIIFEDNISIVYKKALCFLNDKTSGYKVSAAMACALSIVKTRFTPATYATAILYRLGAD